MDRVSQTTKIEYYFIIVFEEKSSLKNYFNAFVKQGNSFHLFKSCILELPSTQTHTHAYARISYHRHLASSSSTFSSNYYFTVAIIIITLTQALIHQFNEVLMR